VLIAKSPPAVNADTHDHGGLDRSTSDANRTHTPIAPSASPASDPSRAAGGSNDASSARAHRRK